MSPLRASGEHVPEQLPSSMQQLALLQSESLLQPKYEIGKNRRQVELGSRGKGGSAAAQLSPAAYVYCHLFCGCNAGRQEGRTLQ